MKALGRLESLILDLLFRSLDNISISDIKDHHEREL